MDDTITIGNAAIPWPEKLLLEIFERFPPSDSIFKDVDRRASAEYDDELRHPFQKWFGREADLFAGRDILDLGCGYGGRTVRFNELGARSTTGVEINQHLISHAEEFARSRHSAAQFLVGCGERIPTADNQFDLITMSDVMEHVVTPDAVLQECFRVLRPGGYLATVFPPYYAVRSGSHLHGYATSFPGLNLIFSTRTLKSAATRLFNSNGIEYWRFLRQNVPTDKLWNMNGLTIRHFKKLVRRTSFHWEQARFIGEFDRRVSERGGVGFALRLPIYVGCEIGSRLPFLQELLCGRVCALLRKQQ